MDYLGDYHKGQTVYVYFATTDSAGANVAPSSAFEAADVVVYDNGSATQITAGITVTSPFDSETGFHLAAIDTSNGAYSRGHDFTVVLAPDETVDSQTITALPIAAFSLENRMPSGGGFRTTIATLASQTSFTLTDGPADDDALNGWAMLVKDAATSHQFCLGIVSDYTGSTKTVTLTADPAIFTMAANDFIEATPAFLTGGLSTQAKADVNAECDTALTDYDAPTNAEMEARTIVAANYATAANLATVDANVDTAVAGVITGAAATGTLSTTQATSDLSGYADDQLIGRVIIWTSGDCEGEATDITDYASASGLLTFTALTTAPADGDLFKVV